MNRRGFLSTLAAAGLAAVSRWWPTHKFRTATEISNLREWQRLEDENTYFLRTARFTEHSLHVTPEPGCHRCHLDEMVAWGRYTKGNLHRLRYDPGEWPA